ncbi:hypothetical protein GCM10010168_46390 [Actinoplanes ianthinogenes]|uniref:Uncharacterized protein n=1 Tax=Actinoplanes ianthinogenes TaxID=122358 RepID=A0ABM7LPD1_9ACTN|nr:hypothetical protein [Actinoplanes ianthinogenes]BCJ41063.1 hypothetical protein Aiant_17200 [Actinoplanes ianthinogenes]GGR23147.1 hypothetical protein GCM10010168_46390 [Actinoplanes ianthinogenes]
MDTVHRSTVTLYLIRNGPFLSWSRVMNVDEARNRLAVREVSKGVRDQGRYHHFRLDRA